MIAAVPGARVLIAIDEHPSCEHAQARNRESSSSVITGVSPAQNYVRINGTVTS